MIVEPKDTVAPEGWKVFDSRGEGVAFIGPGGSRYKFTAGADYIDKPVRWRGYEVFIVFVQDHGWCVTPDYSEPEQEFTDFPFFDTFEEAYLHLTMAADTK